VKKIHWNDLEEGAVFWGDTVTVDPEEMLEYARRNDPQPFHLDANEAKTSPFGGCWIYGHVMVSVSYTYLDKAGFSWRL
jgi:acyl dehydratase